MRYFLLALLFSFSTHALPVSETGLPLPRFVSLKGNDANMRNGPGKRYPVKWNYQRKGLPVKIINEYQHWRQIEDHEGIQGWMHKSMLSGRRTAMVMANDIALQSKPNETSEPKAKLMQNVIVEIEACRRDWCEISIAQKEGWLPISILWGTQL